MTTDKMILRFEELRALAEERGTPLSWYGIVIYPGALGIDTGNAITLDEPLDLSAMDDPKPPRLDLDDRLVELKRLAREREVGEDIHLPFDLEAVCAYTKALGIPEDIALDPTTPLPEMPDAGSRQTDE